MEEQILEFLNKYNINLKNKKIVIAVSTGVDSMTLLNIFLKLNLCEIIVAHVNHGKREQSKDEEAYIKEYCVNSNLKFHIAKLPKIEGNFQESARLFRQKFFKEIIEKESAHYLLLAHHLNDDIETMLMRLIRGSNLIGYAGINEYLDMGSYIILRPFLKVLKKDILEYAKRYNIKYYDDCSNRENIYTRNRIRNRIIPEIFALSENFGEKFIEFKKAIISVNNASKIIRDNFINIHVKTFDKAFSFKLNNYKNLDTYFQIEVLFELLKDYRFSKVNILEIIKLINSEKKNLKTFYKGITFVKEYNDITIFCYNKKDKPFRIVIDSLGEFRIDENRKLIVKKKNDINVTNSYKIWYNSNKFPIVARSKLPGDRIAFSYGHKKISKFMIDEKIGISDREKAIILEKDNEVLAIIGYTKSIKLQNITDSDIIIELKEKDNDD